MLKNLPGDEDCVSLGIDPTLKVPDGRSTSATVIAAENQTNIDRNSVIDYQVFMNFPTYIPNNHMKYIKK